MTSQLKGKLKHFQQSLSTEWTDDTGSLAPALDRARLSAEKLANELGQEASSTVDPIADELERVRQRLEKFKSGDW